MQSYLAAFRGLQRKGQVPLYAAVSGEQQKAGKFLERENGCRMPGLTSLCIDKLRFSTHTQLCLLQHLH